MFTCVFSTPVGNTRIKSRRTNGPNRLYTLTRSLSVADLEAEWLANGETTVPSNVNSHDAMSQNSVRPGASESHLQQLHVKVGFSTGMPVHVHGTCIDDRVRVAVESSEGLARNIRLHATATLTNKDGALPHIPRLSTSEPSLSHRVISLTQFSIFQHRKRQFVL